MGVRTPPARVPKTSGAPERANSTRPWGRSAQRRPQRGQAQSPLGGREDGQPPARGHSDSVQSPAGRATARPWRAPRRGPATRPTGTRRPGGECAAARRPPMPTPGGQHERQPESVQHTVSRRPAPSPEQLRGTSTSRATTAAIAHGREAHEHAAEGSECKDAWPRQSRPDDEDDRERVGDQRPRRELTGVTVPQARARVWGEPGEERHVQNARQQGGDHEPPRARAMTARAAPVPASQCGQREQGAPRRAGGRGAGARFSAVAKRERRS